MQTLAAVAVTAALWRQGFSDRGLGWALRLGLSIAILGAAAGGLMTRPTEAQLAAMRAGARISVIGAHTVGAPDGGPGLPGTNWSLEHGDLRIPHFLGLHAMQALPLLAIFLRRRRWAETARVRLTLVAAASYLALFSILLFQALRGQSVIDPDAATLTALVTWAALTAVAAGIALARRRPLAVRIA